MTDDREPRSSEKMLAEVESWLKDDHLGGEQEEDPTASIEADSAPVVGEESPDRDPGSGMAGLAPCPSCGRMTTAGEECSVCRDEVEAFRQYQAHGEPAPPPLFTDPSRAVRFVRLVLTMSTIWWIAVVIGFGVMLQVIRSEEITLTAGVLLGLVMALFVVSAVLRIVLWRRFVRPPVRDGVLSWSGFPGWRLYREALAVLGRGCAWIVVPVVMWAVLVAVCIIAGVLAD